jgi:DNA-binding CsgD family transcriptional regulator
VARRLAAASEGNPLGLIEFASLLGEAEREGRNSLPELLPVSESVERGVRRAVEQLPQETRRALLLAAAADSPSGFDAEALAPAASAALVRIHAGAVSFRHPLVRSAVYQAASVRERRRAHRALAATLTEAADVDRCAWHLAAAAAGEDESVASLLEAAADRFAERGGHGSEARALERAAELSEDDDNRGRRLVSAAVAAHFAGRSERALDLLARALAVVREPLVRVDAAYLTSFIQAWRGIAVDQAEVEKEAWALASAEPGRAAKLLQHSANGAWIADFDLRRATALLRDAVELDTGGSIEVTGIAIRSDLALMLALLGHTSEAKAMNETVPETREPLLDIWLEQYTDARACLESRLEAARATGDTAATTVAALDLSYLEWLMGNFPAAEAMATQALELAEMTGWRLREAQAHIVLTLVAAVRGNEDEARTHAARADAAFTDRPRATLKADTRIALGLLELGLGRPDAAIAELRPVAELAAKSGLREPSGLPYAPDLIEAYVLVGERDAAEEELERFEGQARAVSRRWALAAAARLRGFLAPDEDVDTHFGEALMFHEAGAGSPFDGARTEFLYGVRLRRAKRKTEAREQLRAAIGRFDELGAGPWSERARVELRASGERLPRRDPTAPEKLTSQELQIALQVAEGKSNRDVAAALFLSPKTVEFHLTRVYRKLQLHSRSELIRCLASRPAAESTAAATIVELSKRASTAGEGFRGRD